ncbi:MAG TPA: hypothetical protein VF668_04795 [Pyrinomonadaceae bacterium]|jgi:hypothetical protein
MSKALTDEQKRALVDHEAQVNGPSDPNGTKLSDGRTVAKAQADAERVNNEWEAARQKRMADKAAARESARTAADAPQGGAQQQAAAGSKPKSK